MKRLCILAMLACLTACAKGSDPAPLATRQAGRQAGAAPVANAPVILAFGDSLYAGYQLDPGDSYPAQLQLALNRAGIPVRVVNAGVSGDTTAAALGRLRFTLDGQPQAPALVLVGLGGNDMLRGIDPAETRSNLAAILTELHRRHLPVLLTGMLAAPNLGARYAQAFNPIWPNLARQYDVPLVPFFLQAVIGQPVLQLADHMHPNAQGVERIVAATEAPVASALKAAQQ